MIALDISIAKIRYMRTVIDIDDEALRKAKRLTGLKTKVDVVNFALRELVRQREIEELLKLAGRVDWDGDLETMRADRVSPH
jgi:Arc/MetJ family transcription regulator